MPVKRRLSKSRPYRITPDLVELWVKLNAIRDAGEDEEWEPKGRQREFLDGNNALDRALGVKLWEEGPLYVDGPEPPAYMRSDAQKVEGWQRAWELRCELEEAAR